MKRFLHLAALAPSLVFRMVVWARNRTFDWGLRRISHLERPVFSVGNLAMGGTGKSPVVSSLTAMLTGMGIRVAVLSRGYRRRGRKTSLRVKADTDWRVGGDEPLMIARQNPAAAVFVGPSRAAAASAASGWDPGVFLLDDGFQHRQLHRDLDLVLLDVTQPPPSLMASFFREGWRALKRADAVVLTRCPPERDVSDWIARIHTAVPGLPIHRVWFEPRGLVGLDGTRQPLAFLRGKRVAAYCGIAKPDQFFGSLSALGARLVATHPLADHRAAPAALLAEWASRCHAAGDLDLIVTTAKDAVKLDRASGFGIYIYALSIEAVWEKRDHIAQWLQSCSCKENE